MRVAAGGRRLSPDASVALLRRARRLSGHLPPQWDRRVREVAKVVLNYRGARAGGLRGIRFRRLARHSSLLVAPFGDGQLLVDAADDEIGRVVYMTGGYERVYLQTAVQQLAAAGIDVAGTTFVDIGANIGTSSIDALLHFGFGRAVCFEPSADNARLLAMNATLNGLEDRMAIHVLALGDRDGTAVLSRSAHNSGDHRLITEQPAATTASEEVRLVRLDTLVADGSVDLTGAGLVWMDVQGHEPFVLSGAAAVTEQRVPMVLEYTPAALAGGGQAVLEQLVIPNYSTVVDLHLTAHGCSGSSFPADDLPSLPERLHGVDHTDLLLLP